MTQTLQFSQFVVGGDLQSGDLIAGLRNGLNTIFNAPSATGGGGSVTQVITQSGNTFAVGNWIGINSAGIYAKSQADTPADAECVGIVIQILVANETFVLQQAGYIQPSQNVFAGALMTGPYFLDTAVQGNMVQVDASINNQVSRPVFLSDGTNSGWVLPYRGLIVGGTNPTGGGSSSIPSAIQNTIEQIGHNLEIGQFVYIAAYTGQPIYDTAQANAFATSGVVGMVVEVISSDEFVLQTDGYLTQNSYNPFPLIQDDTGNPLNGGKTYYLSPTVAGSVTAINPETLGLTSVPVYYCEQTTDDLSSIDAGYVLSQRPLDLSGQGGGDDSILTVIQENTFAPGNWVYIAGDTSIVTPKAWQLAQANTLATSQSVGVVTSANTNSFTVQLSGAINGVVTQDAASAPIVSGPIYYLSPTVAGAITSTIPTTVGQATKPCYVQQTLIGNYGIILPQRPNLITPGGGSGGSGSVIQTLSTYVNKQTIRCLTVGQGIWTMLVDGTSNPGYPPVFTLTITPTSATNNIRITANLQLAMNTGAATYAIFRNATYTIPTAPAPTPFITGGVIVGSVVETHNNTAGAWNSSTYINIIDSPATTGATVYTIGAVTNNSTNTATNINSSQLAPPQPFPTSYIFTSFMQVEEIVP